LSLKEEFITLLKEDETFRYAVAGFLGLEEILKRLDRNEQELVRLREDMVKGFELMNRHINALGARWGLMSEESFRDALRGLLGRELDLWAERWVYSDVEGCVYGYPSMVEVDVALHDEKTILIEVSSHVRASDVAAFKRKAEFYEKVTGKKPSRLLMVTPYAEDDAKEACGRIGVELYTKV